MKAALTDGFGGKIIDTAIRNQACSGGKDRIEWQLRRLKRDRSQERDIERTAILGYDRLRFDIDAFDTIKRRELPRSDVT